MTPGERAKRLAPVTLMSVLTLNVWAVWAFFFAGSPFGEGSGR